MRIGTRIWISFVPLIAVGMLAVGLVAFRGSLSHYANAKNTAREVSVLRENLATQFPETVGDESPYRDNVLRMLSGMSLQTELLNAHAALYRKDILSFIHYFVVLSLLAVLTASLLGIWMARQIADPIARLRERARVIAQGDLSPTPPLRASGEIRDLAMDIDLLRNRIRGHIENLDRLVEERTCEVVRNEALFRAVFEYSGVGMVRTDSGGHILDSNAAMCEFLGYAKDELSDMNIKDLTFPADWDSEKTAIRAVLSGSCQGCVREKRYVRKNGEIRWGRLSLSVVRDGNGHPQFTIGAVTDISEHRRNQENLLAREWEYRMLFTSMTNGFALQEVVCDSDGRPRDYRFLVVNPAFVRLIGLKRESIVGRLATEVLPGLDRFWVNTFGEVALTGVPANFERYSEELGKHLAVTAYRPDKNRVAVIFNDITAQKLHEQERLKLERQIQHAQKLDSLGVLAGGIAHDFNNLLMGILGNADLALAQMSQGAAGSRELKEIEKASHRAADLCRQMLAYSGKGRFVVELTDINELLTELEHMLHVSISKKVTLRMNLGAHLPPIEADATQIRQVIMNLIINASEAIGEASGTISVSTDVKDFGADYFDEIYWSAHLPGGRYVCIEVRDTGCGMTQEVKERLFDPFFTTKFSGRGLGMAAVLGILRGHNGAIRVYSEPGRGATFNILLPASAKSITAAPVASKPMESWTGSGTVLLVDDEDVVLNVGRLMLERLGFNVATARSGREAVETFAHDPGGIDCIILDLTMPEMGGEEAFSRIRDLRADSRIVLCSGYNEQDVIQRFNGKCLAGFIQKPYRAQDLAAVLKRVMENTSSASATSSTTNV